ncbi:MAG: UvrD-helicase domain-containing protein [Candidatus Margulisiibacteriota bacterium]
MNAHPQIIAVEASAGSGKTYSLAKHYIKLLMQDYKTEGPNSFTGILAVTFTNKASYEMKQRILGMLKTVELDSFKGPDEKKELLSYWGVDLATAKKMSIAFLDAIIGNYTHFQVRTIDSFINNVIMACSFEMDLPSHFDIEHDYKPYLSQALDSLIDDADDDEAIRGKFTAFLDRFLNIEQKVNWYPQKDILETVVSLYNDASTYGGKFKASGQGTEIIHIKRNEFKDLIGKLSKIIPAGTNANLKKGIEKAAAMVSDSGLDIARLSKYFQRDDYQVNAGHDVPLEVEKLWKKIRKELKDICEADSFTQFDTYIDIYNMMTARFRELSRRDRILFLPELNRIARGVFEEADIHVPDLYFRLAARIRHYLLDEFQDTNDLQWSNFKPMIDEAISSGGSFFYVGDKKQSIYRFRGANSALFDEVKGEFPGYQLDERDLEDNWRSAKEIVEFNNSVFSKDNIDSFLAPLTEEISGLEDAVHNVFRNTKQNTVKTSVKGSVKAEYIDDGDEEAEELIKKKTIEETKVFSSINGLSNVCILCRDNSEVEDVSSWLIEAGIPVQSEKTLNIKENPLIKELISFLMFLDSLVDDTAFASFISGRMLSKASGIEQGDIGEFLFDNRSDKKTNKAPLYKSFKKKYNSQWGQYIQDLSRKVGFIPLYEFVIIIMDRFNVLENFPEDHAYFMKLLELISEKEKKLQTVAEFLEFFEGAKENIYVSGAGSDAVKVMTIHKAKGLEFTSVIIPFLKMEPKISGPRKKSYVVAKTGQDLRLVRLRKEYNGYSDVLERIYNAEYIKSFCDELNNVYVALTRPINNLVVFIPPKAGRTKNIVRGLVIPSAPSGHLPLGKGENAENDVNIMHIHPDRLGDPISLIKGEDFTENAISKRQSRVLGNVAHCLLSKITDAAHPLTDEIMEAARKQFPYADIAIPKKWVEKLLKNKKTAAFFETGDEAYTEKEVVNSKGEMNRIDRLIVKKDEVWVIDFKSSDDNIRDHYSQIKRYEDALKQIYKRSKVRGFLIYFDTCQAEEVDG